MEDNNKKKKGNIPVGEPANAISREELSKLSVDELQHLLNEVLEQEDYIKAIAIRDEINKKKKKKRFAHPMLAFPNCKINIGLNVIRKRNDGFHDIETVFYPIPLCDVLEIIHSPNEKNIHFSSSGLAIDSPLENNLCIKALRLLQQDFPQVINSQIHLHKIIPYGAGLGGGSADAAFTLQLLNKVFSS